MGVESLNLMQLQKKKMNQLADEIFLTRSAGNINDAIMMGEKAIVDFPNNNFFYKILGDMYFQNRQFEQSMDAYLNFLMYIANEPFRFYNFGQFYKKLNANVLPSLLSKYKDKIELYINEKRFSPEISSKLFELLELNTSGEIPELRRFKEIASSDNNFDQIVKEIKKIEDKISILNAIFKYTLERKRTNGTLRIDTYIASVMERFGQFENAMTIITEVLEISSKADTIGTLFRLCRKINDYAIATSFIDTHPSIRKNRAFNLQYELVYYFEKTNRTEDRDYALKKIFESGNQSIPIMNTLYNFYLQFEMMDDADTVQRRISELGEKKQTKQELIEAQYESEEGVWQKYKELVSEQENARRMTAMMELLKGFSHELGQPITNIRYAIQLHEMKVEKKIEDDKHAEKLLPYIMIQTDRIGKLLRRFNPIMSSKSIEKSFNVKEQIVSVFSELNQRLASESISYQISAEESLELFLDPVQFDQIFYNLIINSIHAIKNSNKTGNITIQIFKINKFIHIEFIDNGTGIPKDIAAKIFEPFFSTKDKAKDDGGEGLGLFIVWNILKMLGGTIALDKNYVDGAKFIIKILEKRSN